MTHEQLPDMMNLHSFWQKVKDWGGYLDRYFSTPGQLIGILFFAFSLTPSLLPRTSFVQGVTSGVAFTAGYGLGVTAEFLWLYLGLPVWRRWVRRIALIGTTFFSAVLAILFLWWANDWQNSVRQAVGMEKATEGSQLVTGIVALLVFLILLGMARLFRRTFQLFSNQLEHYVSRRLSIVTGFAISILLFWGIINGVILSFLLRSVDRSYRKLDRLMEPEVQRPAASLKAGSPASHLSWEGMGRQGRRFVSGAPAEADLREYVNRPVKTPIRVYAGLNNAKTPEQRAKRVLLELQRVDAFDRSVMVLVTPTGTGWVNESGIRPLEYLYRGDVATVAAQYSYLPSPVALMYEGEYGVETSRALFRTVYGYWQTLPEESRPKLYLYGLSLGALNSDRSFDFYDIIDDPFQGVLWSGPPFRSETWQTITRQRQPDSPVWKPRFRDDSVVRFGNQHGGFSDGKAPWGSFRIAFLQYASDPVTFFHPSYFYREPEWLSGKRGPDVSDELRWFPVVTMLQLAVDLSLGHSPPGYGHHYSAEDYLNAWYHLTEPPGWRKEQLQDLEQKFEQFREVRQRH